MDKTHNFFVIFYLIVTYFINPTVGLKHVTMKFCLLQTIQVFIGSSPLWRLIRNLWAQVIEEQEIGLNFKKKLFFEFYKVFSIFFYKYIKNILYYWKLAWKATSTYSMPFWSSQDPLEFKIHFACLLVVFITWLGTYRNGCLGILDCLTKFL